MKKIFTTLMCCLITMMCYSASQSNGSSAPSEEAKSHISLPSTVEVEKPIRASIAREDLSIPPRALHLIRERLVPRSALTPSHTYENGLNILLPIIPEYDSSNGDGE